LPPLGGFKNSRGKTSLLRHKKRKSFLTPDKESIKYKGKSSPLFEKLIKTKGSTKGGFFKLMRGKSLDDQELGGAILTEKRHLFYLSHKLIVGREREEGGAPHGEKSPRSRQQGNRLRAKGGEASLILLEKMPVGKRPLGGGGGGRRSPTRENFRG